MHSLNNNNGITFYKKNVSNVLTERTGRGSKERDLKKIPTFYILIPCNEEYLTFILINFMPFLN